MEESLKLKNKRPSSSQGPESSSSQGPGSSSSQGPGSSSSQGPGSSSSQGPTESNKRSCTELAKASNALECDICCNVFSEYNSPRNLPCSHTFCGPCINGIIMTQKKTCPICRKRFTATSAEDLMINRIVLDVVKQLLKERKSKEFKKKLTKETIHEKKTRVLQELKILDGMKDVLTATETLNGLKDGLLETKKEIGRFKEMLTDIELSIEKIVNKITESGDQLEAATDLTSTDPFHDAQEKVKEIKDLLQKNQRERDDITMEIQKMRIQLVSVIGEMQKFIEVEPLEMTAVKVVKGKQMVAPVKVKPRNQVRLSHFAKEDVPPKSLLIEHEALMKISSRRAFLDLAVGEIFLGRIIIKVMDEGNLALNFLHVCAGDLGPSYANSRLSIVYRNGECIFVSPHLKSVMEVDWKKEREREIYKDTPIKAGDVRGFFSDGDTSLFEIFTRDDPSRTNNACFGIVEEGLDVLRNAISRYWNITYVRIVDIGLMFPL